MFNNQKDYFTVEDWTRDNSDKSKGIKVESDMNPDLLIRYNLRNERFAVECKYRTTAVWSEERKGMIIKWSYPQQIKRYNEFSKTKGIPVFVIIGIGGTPGNPKTMYCIPLKDAKYPEIYMNVLKKYERPP